MPIKKTVMDRDPQPVPEQEEIKERAELLAFEPAEAEAIQPGRPHQAFVESQLRQYLHDNNIRSLVKPTQEEIRAAAMPILCQAWRRRTGWEPLASAHHAVADVVEHIREERWTRRPLTEAYACTTYLDALIQLADDTYWLAREIPLLDHPEPKHPPIYYMINLKRNWPVPRADSLIRGDYVYDPETGSRITRDEYIYPWLEPHCRFPLKRDLIDLGRDAIYSLNFGRQRRVRIIFHWIKQIDNEPVYFYSPALLMHFSPSPPIVLGRSLE